MKVSGAATGTNILTAVLLSFSCCGVVVVRGQTSVKPKIRGGLLEQWDRQLKTQAKSMLDAADDYEATVLWTVGQSSPVSNYTPPGIFDGMGAYMLNNSTVRVLANHELRNMMGYEYVLRNGLAARGARISYFDIDVQTYSVMAADLAYELLYTVDGDPAVEHDSVFLNDYMGLSRFCSGRLVKPGQFESGSGIEELIYFAPEEDGGRFNENGGHYWALDVEGEIRGLWDIGDLGRGAWENLAPVDTNDEETVGFILTDDTSPFDFDPSANNGDEAAPLYLYIGKKDNLGDFLGRNGLRGGDLHVLVPDDRALRTPGAFNGAGNSMTAKWIKINNTRNEDLAGTGGRLGYDDFGWPRQGNLFAQAKAAGAFGFSRPEDVHENPSDPSTVVLASTGVDTYDVNPLTGNGFDTWGTLYLISTDFEDLTNLTATMSIVYDGNQDKRRTIRSGDNLVWSPSGSICVQEDEAEEVTLSKDEVLWSGPGVAVNENEAGIVCFQVDGQHAVPDSFERIASIDRRVILDASIENPEDAVDMDKNKGGEWESSGIIDVSKMFGKDDGTLYIVNVQAHGIEDQEGDSRIIDEDLVEGGQLLILEKKELELSSSD